MAEDYGGVAFLLAGGDPEWKKLREPGSIAFVKPPGRKDEVRDHKRKQEQLDDDFNEAFGEGEEG